MRTPGTPGSPGLTAAVSARWRPARVRGPTRVNGAAGLRRPGGFAKVQPRVRAE